MGCLHWTFEELRHTDVNAIELALEGHRELVQSIFGGKEEEAEEQRKPRPMTAERFKSLARRHNSIYLRRNKHG